MYSVQHCKDKITQAINDDKLYAVRTEFKDIQMLHKLGQWRGRAAEYLPKEKRLVFNPLGACLNRSDLEWIMNYKNFAGSHNMHVDNMRAYYNAPFTFASPQFMLDVNYVCQMILQIRLQPLSFDPKAWEEAMGKSIDPNPRTALTTMSEWLYNYLK